MSVRVRVIEGNGEADHGINNNSRNHSTECINQQPKRIELCQLDRLFNNFLWATRFRHHEKRHCPQSHHRLENRFHNSPVHLAGNYQMNFGRTTQQQLLDAAFPLELGNNGMEGEL